MEIATRLLQDLVEEVFDKGFIVCNTEKEYDHLTEYLYSEEQAYKVEFIDQGMEFKGIKISIVND